MWQFIEAFKMVGFLMELSGTATMFDAHKIWKFSMGNENVKCESIAEPKNRQMPLLQIKLVLIKQFVKSTVDIMANTMKI